MLPGFTNPTQILDTVFEVKAAHYCFSLPGASSLEFSPEYLVNGNRKFPDFRFDGPFGRFVCECKDIEPQTHKSHARFQKINEAIIPAVKLLVGVSI